MRPIQMVDLKGQYTKIKDQVDLAIREVLETTAFINGKAVNEFSQHLSAYLGIEHVIPCANGTDALQIALMGLGLEPGDEVITPSFTFIATTEVVPCSGLNPYLLMVDTKDLLHGSRFRWKNKLQKERRPLFRCTYTGNPRP